MNKRYRELQLGHCEEFPKETMRQSMDPSAMPQDDRTAPQDDIFTPQDDTPTASALFLSAFFDELIRCGVRDVVVSPGSRSTPLSMVAHASDLRLFVDVDERGAAFFALGLAKASGRPVALICTSGTAVVNYYPAILEAHTSRVPLIVLTADRPPRLQNLGAPQTCDQLNIFGNYVRAFQQMPLPSIDSRDIAFARQMAIEAFLNAVGTHVGKTNTGELWYGCISNAGVVHLNFPFEEPLKPNLQVEGLFKVGRSTLSESRVAPLVPVAAKPSRETIEQIVQLMKENRTIVLCGEGSIVNEQDRKRLLQWACRFHLPVLADPLSNLRSDANRFIISGYDRIFAHEEQTFSLVIRFGRYPVSKSCFSACANTEHIQIVVDAEQTRDFNATTDLFIPTTPMAFVEAFLEHTQSPEDVGDTGELGFVGQTSFAQQHPQRFYASTWLDRNDEETLARLRMKESGSDFPGMFIDRLPKLLPENSCLFVANSMAIRLVDNFFWNSDKMITILGNRGLSGIDGTLSSAIGAAYAFKQTTLLIGDIALLHDLNALALQREILSNVGAAASNTSKGTNAGSHIPGIVIVVLNNNGGAIFDLLPQSSDEPYFERLFRTPQEVDFVAVAIGFNVPSCRVETVSEFETAYLGFCGQPGLHLIEVTFEPGKLKDYYGGILS